MDIFPCVRNLFAIMNLKLLFVTDWLSGGGAERAISVFCGGLADLGYDVSLLVFRKTDNEYPLNEKIHVIRLGEKYSFNDRSVFERNVRRLPEIRRIIKTVAPDYIFSFMEGNIIVTKLATMFMKQKIIAGVRCDLKNDPGIYPHFIRDFFIKRCYKIFCQNNQQIQYFSKRYQKKSFAVSNALRNELSVCKKNRYGKIKNIVSIGRLTEQKNQTLLINAFVSVLNKTSGNMTLTIYGEGDLRESLVKLIKDKGIEKSVFLPGWISDVCKALVEADLFVLSSDYEGMPNTLMEAMAVGLPCISTDCPTGPSDLIKNNETGILVPVGDEKALSNAIMDMIDNSEKAADMAKRARSYIWKEYEISSVCSKLMKKVME